MNEEILSNEEFQVEPAGPKTAMVSIIGRPSAGKSTFLNAATQETVSIVSSVPQTTRNAIRGIVNTSIGQLVFIDTPGLHLSEKKFNLKLTAIAEENIKDSDEILYVLDSTREHADEEEMIARLVAPFSKKTVVAVNKIESQDSRPENSRAFIHRMLPDLPDSRIIEMSAKEDKGVNDVLSALYDLAEEGPHLYPEEFYTDQEVGFRISEIIRGEAINRLEQELPHAIYVNIKDMEMATPNLLKVRAEICVERESQKGIVIGKGAQMIKNIRIESMKTARKIFPYRVDIELTVVVDKNWRQKDRILNKIVK